MEVTTIGMLCAVLCIGVVMRPLTLGMLLFAGFLPLQTAAAINLPAVGGSSISCAHFMLGAFGLALLLRPSLLTYVLNRSLHNRAFQLFALFVAYALFSAYFMPAVFGGAVEVYSFERVPEGEYQGTVLLHRTTSNLTQSVYLFANLLAFGIFSGMLMRPGGTTTISRMLTVTTSVHIFFGVLELIPLGALTSPIFEFIRTANYAILVDHEIAGVRRIIGSYTEASLFGTVSVGLLAFNALRFFQTRSLGYGVFAFLLALLSMLSFSTTAYAAIGIALVLILTQSMVTSLFNGIRREDLTLLILNAIATIFVLLLLLYPPMQEVGARFYDAIFGSKLTSDSGVERAAWSERAISNAFETNGFGVGLGSAKGSGAASALLSNTGFLGFALYILFLIAAVFHPAPRVDRNSSRSAFLARRLFIALRGSVTVLMIALLISATTVDPGIIFIVMAAMANVVGRRVKSPFDVEDVQPAPRSVDPMPGVRAAKA